MSIYRADFTQVCINYVDIIKTIFLLSIFIFIYYFAKVRFFQKTPDRVKHTKMIIFIYFIYKKIIIHIIFFILLVVTGCGRDIREESILNRLNGIAGSLNINFDDIHKLSDKRIGRTGYYYAIDIDGRVIYHPQKGLIGFSFKDDPFIKRVIELKKGCIRQSFEGVEKIIFFRSIDEKSILCFTISSNEIQMHQYLNCENL